MCVHDVLQWMGLEYDASTWELKRQVGLPPQITSCTSLLPSKASLHPSILTHASAADPHT
jgi:hypothetical protein